MINIIENNHGYFLHYAGLSEEEISLGKNDLCSRPQDLLKLKRKVENGEFPELSNKEWCAELLKTIDSDFINARKVRENILKGQKEPCKCYQCCLQRPRG